MHKTWTDSFFLTFHLFYLRVLLSHWQFHKCYTNHPCHMFRLFLPFSRAFSISCSVCSRRLDFSEASFRFHRDNRIAHKIAKIVQITATVMDMDDPNVLSGFSLEDSDLESDYDEGSKTARMRSEDPEPWASAYQSWRNPSRWTSRFLKVKQGTSITILNHPI